MRQFHLSFPVSRTVTLIGLVILLLGTQPAAAGTASGRFTLDKGGSISPTVATAYPVREQYDARTESVEIALSTAPFEVDATSLSPHSDAINQDAMRKDNYILLWVMPDGQVSMNATFSATMTQFLDQTGPKGKLTAELTANTPGHIAGRVFTTAPVKVMSGESYTVDVTFAVDVTRPSAGTTLPAGGGDPGKAFAALMASAQKKNWNGIKSGVTEDLRGRFEADYRTPKENLEYSVDFLQTTLPKSKRKVTGGILRGETATLEVEGEMFAGQKALYFARMVRSKGKWLFDGSSMAGLVK